MEMQILSRRFCLPIFLALLTGTLAWAILAWAGDRRMNKFKVSGQGELRLMVPEDWQAEFQRPISETAPTILFLPEKGKAFKLLITIQWDGAGGPDFNSASRLNTLLEKEWSEMSSSVEETQLDANKILGKETQGIYFLSYG